METQNMNTSCKNLALSMREFGWSENFNLALDAG